MKILKEGGHRLFETDPETARYVADLLGRLRRDGLDAVRHALTARVGVERYRVKPRGRETKKS